jgi:polyhydroxyalkanoate synthesis regulator phasin
MPHITWTTPKVLALAGVSLVAGTALVGVASAQTPESTRQQKADEHLNRLAQNLGVDVAKLKDAMKQTALQHVDEALAAGKITAEQAQKMKDAINSGQMGPGFGPMHGGPRRGPEGFGGPGGPGGPRGGMRAPGPEHDKLAAFFGITPEQLKQELLGKSLADVAAAHGKSVDALKQSIVSNAEQRLNEAVSAGKLTQEQATKALDALKSHLDELVNQVHQPRQFGPGPRGPQAPQGGAIPSGA